MNIPFCSGCGRFHAVGAYCGNFLEMSEGPLRPRLDPVDPDEIILVVFIREEGGYYEIVEVDSNYVIHQAVTRPGAVRFCEENGLDVRSE